MIFKSWFFDRYGLFCLGLMILTMSKYHENLLRDSILSLHFIVKFFSSLEIKMVLKNVKWNLFKNYPIFSPLFSFSVQLLSFLLAYLLLALLSMIGFPSVIRHFLLSPPAVICPRKHVHDVLEYKVILSKKRIHYQFGVFMWLEKAMTKFMIGLIKNCWKWK